MIPALRTAQSSEEERFSNVASLERVLLNSELGRFCLDLFRWIHDAFLAKYERPVGNVSAKSSKSLYYSPPMNT